MSPAEMLAEFPAALGDEPGRGNAGLRYTLHREEHKELVDELTDERSTISGRIRVPKDDAAVDREHLARELADVVYLAYGTAHAFDIDLEAALAEIHRAAMSKLGPGMRVRADGKVLKPEGFVPPDMKRPWGGADECQQRPRDQRLALRRVRTAHLRRPRR